MPIYSFASISNVHKDLLAFPKQLITFWDYIYFQKQNQLFIENYIIQKKNLNWICLKKNCNGCHVTEHFHWESTRSGYSGRRSVIANGLQCNCTDEGVWAWLQLRKQRALPAGAYQPAKLAAVNQYLDPHMD